MLQNSNRTNQRLALLLVRVILGLIFFWQGYGKVFTWGIDNLIQMDFFLPTYENLLPTPIVIATAYFTSLSELLGGLMLVLGWKRDWALYMLSIVLFIVTFGHGLATPIWDLSHVMYRLLLILILFLLPKEWDWYRFR